MSHGVRNIKSRTILKKRELILQISVQHFLYQGGNMLLKLSLRLLTGYNMERLSWTMII